MSTDKKRYFSSIIYNMENLGKYLTEPNVIAALDQVIREKPKLLKATKFALLYKGQRFPPKEIARIAAMIGGIPKQELTGYRLNGGNSINRHFVKLGFEIIQFADRKKETETGSVQDERRLVRLCGNKDGWVGPSGWEGKSEDPTSHEARFGYGHEEWLFDTGRLIDGYHYGFIEPIRKRMDAYKNKIYDVTFFTIDGSTKTRCWAGRIKELEVIDQQKAEEIKQVYIEQKWLMEMEDRVKEIQALNANVEKTGWSNFKGLDFFNVRFRPESLSDENQYKSMGADHPAVWLNRYNFNFLKAEHLAGMAMDSADFAFSATNKQLPPPEDGVPLKRTFTREPGSIEISYLHQRISYGLTRKLREQYGDLNVEPDHAAGFLGREIDIAVKDGTDVIFYEIKTYGILIQSIRVAVGQIMEYALWSRDVRAAKWIIVTQPHADIESAKAYFGHLRSRYNLPLFFRMYDWKTDVLTEPV